MVWSPRHRHLHGYHLGNHLLLLWLLPLLPSQKYFCPTARYHKSGQVPQHTITTTNNLAVQFRVMYIFHGDITILFGCPIKLGFPTLQRPLTMHHRPLHGRLIWWWSPRSFGQRICQSGFKDLINLLTRIICFLLFMEKNQEVLSTCAACAVHSMSFFLYVSLQRLATSSKVSTLPMSTTSRKALAWSKQAWPDGKKMDELSTFEGPSKTLTWWRKINVCSFGFIRFPMFNFKIHIHIIIASFLLVPPAPWSLEKMFMSFFTRPWCFEHAERILKCCIFSRWMVSWSPKFYQN